MRRAARPRPRGVPDVLEALIAKVPAPKGDPDAPLQALIIDSWFDNYVGVVMLVRVVNGTLRAKDKVLLMATGAQHLVEQVGVFSPKSVRVNRCRGQVASSSPHQGTEGRQGGRHHHPRGAAQGRRAAAGFKEVKPQVFAACIRSRPTSTRRCANRWRSCS